MAEYLREIAFGLPLAALLAIVAASVFALSKGADVLVAHAVTISRRFRVSPVVIGATVVSLGTTAPETAVSVLSAVEGDPGLALGNAVGSVICNTALIVGVAAMIRPIPVEPEMVRRQGAVQYGTALLLVALSFPFLTGSGQSPFIDGGRFAQWGGFLLIGLLAVYLVVSVRWGRESNRRLGGHSAGDHGKMELDSAEADASGPLLPIVLKLVGGLAVVLASSQILIPAVEATALRVGVPRAVVAASLVALGTSLPELMTAVQASRRGHGELAFGNVVGANVLNVLFVVGLSTAVTPGGLEVSSGFFRLFYPAMLVTGAILYGSAILGRGRIGRPAGVILLVLYVGLLTAGYTL
jgi:cation:H+ antiporter